MDEREWLAERFEENRTHLRAVAYRMLGSLAEADDVVQETWLRLNRQDAHEEPLDAYVPDPILSREDRVDPEQEALLADSIGLALLVVLEQLPPRERLAFVLHDTFEVPLEDIALILGCSSVTARQLASRGRRRSKEMLGSWRPLRRGSERSSRPSSPRAAMLVAHEPPPHRCCRTVSRC
jgi:DNA-directed RNA polymerase specialized sigma24 family protein